MGFALNQFFKTIKIRKYKIKNETETVTNKNMFIKYRNIKYRNIKYRNIKYRNIKYRNIKYRNIIIH